MSKKVLIILFIVGIIVIALLLYFVLFRTPKTPSTPLTNITNTPISKLPVTQDQWNRMTIQERAQANLPLYQWPTEITNQPAAAPAIPQISEVANGGKTLITPVSNNVVSQAAIAADGQNTVFYNQQDGKFYQSDKDGITTALSDQVFYNVKNVDWSPNKDKAIIEYPDNFKIMYDFKNQKQYSLPTNWEGFSWNQGGGQIAFKATSKYPESSWLAVANPDGSNAQPIENMGSNADKVTVSWSPNNQVIAFSATGQDRGEWEQEMLLIGQHGENFKSLIVDGRGFEPEWNPQGNQIAYSVYSADSDYKPVLYLVDAQGDNIGANKINTGLNTWANKCTFNTAGSELYCAVPKSLPVGSGLVPAVTGTTEDDFYRINTQTGDVSFLAEGAMGSYDVNQIFLSGDESTLYFVDQTTNTLRYIRLK